jgi:hypothetical protein
MLSANRDILTVSLPICIPFTPSSCLIALSQKFLEKYAGDHFHVLWVD